MPLKVTTADFGNPDEEPDFSCTNIDERVAGFLRDSRRGGAGINRLTLLKRRLRSAVQHVHRGLHKHPDISHGLFVWGWFLLRKMLVRIHALRSAQDLRACLESQVEAHREGIMATNGPLHQWLRRVQAVEMGNQDATNNGPTIEGVKSFLLEHPWPPLEPVPKPEVAHKGLGPLQWWRVFALGRRISKENIARWEAAKRRQRVHARKMGEVEDSESVESEDGDDKSS